jgi:anti-anti-sigma regulatory factor
VSEARTKLGEGLHVGDHVCLTYATDRQRRDALASYTRDGVLAGHKVLVYVDPVEGFPMSLSTWLTGAAPIAAPGQIRVQPVGEEVTEGPGVDYAALIDQLRAEVVLARAEGYTGLRLAGDMVWTLRGGGRHPGELDALVGYEAALNEIYGDARTIGLCLYDERRFDRRSYLAVSAAHPGTIACLEDQPLLRFVRTHRGVVLTGEVDASNQRSFTSMLARLTGIESTVTIDAAGLRFIDAAGAGAIVATAARRHGRPTVVHCSPRVSEALWLVGAGQVPGLTVDLTGRGEGLPGIPRPRASREA